MMQSAAAQADYNLYAASLTPQLGTSEATLVPSSTYESSATVLMPQYVGGTHELVEAIQANLKYPATAQENGVEGTVILRVLIDETGNVAAATVDESLTADCDAAALSAVAKLNGFLPARLEGRPFKRSMRIAVNFHL